MNEFDSEPLLSESADSNHFRTACGVLSQNRQESKVDNSVADPNVLPLSRDVSSELSDVGNMDNCSDLEEQPSVKYDRFMESDDDLLDVAPCPRDPEIPDTGLISSMNPASDGIAAASAIPVTASSGTGNTDTGAINALRSLARDSSNITNSGQFSTLSASPNFQGSIENDADSTIFRSDDSTILRACVFLEDAIEYRSIHHRVDKRSLVFYRVYYSKPVQWVQYFVIFTLHMLAFIENPSSLTATSDLRVTKERITLPCGVTEGIEIFCLLILLADLICKSCLKGRAQFLKSKWLWASGVLLIFSIVDWTASMALLCSPTVRARRMVRPFFLLQNSSLMKKTVNCLRKTIPHVVSVLLLLFMHLYFFTLFGMLLFPKEHIAPSNSTNNSTEPQDDESEAYFRDPITAFLSLLVLLTTANNPDVTMPAYSAYRVYSIFFIIFLVIGLYCLMNMLTAVIYNQFRGYFSNSIQSSLFRRRLGIKAAYEVLRRHHVALKYSSSFATLSHGVKLDCLEQVVQRAKIPRKYRRAISKEMNDLPGRLLSYHQIQQIFSVLDADVTKKSRPELPEKEGCFSKWMQKIVVHKIFNYVGCIVAGANVLCITLELALQYDHIRKSRNTFLGIFNLVFVVYFCIEQTLKVWAMGWKRYAYDIGNLLDGIITILLIIAEGVYVATYGIPYWGKDHVTNKGITLWDLVRIINILIMIRLLRMIISQIKAMSVVSTTLFDLVKNLRAFAGILVVIYYFYALLGMELFSGVIKYNNVTDAKPAKCGTYRQLEYWANNFDDFAASLMVLWDVMVVNNWHVFLTAYKEATKTGWSQLYFIVWWLLSVVITLNLFTALILENFIMRWDRHLRTHPREQSEIVSTLAEDSYTPNNFTVHDMFRSDLQEPSEESLTVELRHHSHFRELT